MFCSLCKAEYRQGFVQCSDCRVPLVATEAEAVAIPVRLLWKGESRKKLDEILDALAESGIAYRFHEGMKYSSWFLLFIMQFFGSKPSFEFKVWIFQADFERATAATTLQPAPDVDFDA